MDQEINLFKEQLTLEFFQVQLCFLQNTKKTVQKLFMYLYTFWVKQQIIQIIYHSFIKEIEENSIHGPLKSPRGRWQAKRHNKELKRPIATGKSCLMPVRFLDWNLVIAVTEVKFAKNLTAVKSL